MFCLFIFFGYDFVDDYPSNSDIVLFAQDSIQFEFVESLPKTAIGANEGIKSKAWIIDIEIERKWIKYMERNS